MDESDELELSASRVIPHPPARVWAACTSKESLARWWSPEDLRTTVRRLDVRAGGQVVFHVRYVPALLTKDGAEAFRAARVPISFDLRGKLSEVVPGRLLTFDALEQSFRTFKVRRDPDCPVCGEHAGEITIAEYDDLCMPHPVRV